MSSWSYCASGYLVVAHFPLNRETRWDVGIPGVYVAFAALRGRLQNSHCQTTTYQQENNTSRDQCEFTYTSTCWHTVHANSLSHHIHNHLVHNIQCNRSHVSDISNLTHNSCFSVLQSLFERQGMTLHGGLHPGIEQGHIPLPRGMSRTKSFGKTITHPVHIEIRWMIVYLMSNILVSNILTYREHEIMGKL